MHTLFQDTSQLRSISGGSTSNAGPIARDGSCARTVPLHPAALLQSHALFPVKAAPLFSTHEFNLPERQKKIMPPSQHVLHKPTP